MKSHQAGELQMVVHIRQVVSAYIVVYGKEWWWIQFQQLLEKNIMDFAQNTFISFDVSKELFCSCKNTIKIFQRTLSHQ